MTKSDFTFTNITMAIVIGYCVFMSPLWLKKAGEAFSPVVGKVVHER